MSLKASTRDATQKPTKTRARKKCAALVDSPPVIRNPEMRRRRVSLAEAAREIGLDEATVAETLWEILMRRRKTSSDKPAEIAADKFLLDVVKESVRILDGTRTAASETAEELPTIFRLTHHIPRPVRGE